MIECTIWIGDALKNKGMKLSDYAREHGIGYRAAWNRFKAGKIPGAFLDETGHVVVPVQPVKTLGKTAIYARVSSNKQKEDLERQAKRLSDFAIAKGLTIEKIVKEIASGVNDERPKLTKLLKDNTWDTLVIEHRDRLTRVGFNWFSLFLSQQGKTIIVANNATEENTDLMDDFLSIIYSFAARLYGLRSARTRTKQIANDLGVEYD